MYFIPKEDLIKLISVSKLEILSKEHIDDMFEDYGDTYYLEGGSWGHWEKCVENSLRRTFLAEHQGE